MMRFVLALLVVAACKDKPPTMADFADALCACKDEACREQVMKKVYQRMNEMTEQEFTQNDKNMRRIEECGKSMSEEQR